MTTTSTEVARTTDAPKSLAVQVREVIERQGTAFSQVLPDTVDPDRFARLVVTAVKATPQLMDCFQTPAGQTSVLLAAMKSAAIGLEPNTELQHAWILPRRNRGTTEAQLSIGYRGYLELARRSGDIKDVYAEVVREGDDFRVSYGLHRDLQHTPAPAADRGELTHAYAVAHFMTGGFAFVVLDREEVEARRDRSDSYRSEKARPYSPWTTSEAAMWRKSAIRALVPYLPLSAEVQRDVAADGARLRLDDEDGVIVDGDLVDDDTTLPPPAVTAAELTGGES